MDEELKDDLCSYETAIKLKEKGFPQELDGEQFYYVNGELMTQVEFQDFEDTYTGKIEFCICPTLSLADTWLRKYKEVYTNISATWTNRMNLPDGYISDFDYRGKDFHGKFVNHVIGQTNDYTVFSTYEKALDETIKTALDFIK